MSQVKNRYLIVLVIGLIVAYLFAMQFAASSSRQPQTQSFSPSPFYSPTASQTFTPTCLDNQAVLELTGKSYQLINEQIFVGSTVLECKYESDQAVDGLTPSISYVLQWQTPEAENFWQKQKTLEQSSPSFRQIDGELPLFAVINPVKELNQTSFYVWQKQNYLVISYSPIKEDVSSQVDKGKKLSEKILQQIP